MSMPRFSHMAAKGANIMKAWICAEGKKEGRKEYCTRTTARTARATG